jgi:hypothetical protein
MDPATLATVHKTRIDGRNMTPDQARAVQGEPPLTEQDYAQFDRLFGKPSQTPTRTQGVPV